MDLVWVSAGGRELEVLAGAEDVLPAASVVVLEVDVARSGALRLSDAVEYPGLQIRGSKFEILSLNFRELELSNILGLVLGCIEAKFCK